MASPKNPYLDYTNEELCEVIRDIKESEKEGKRAESLVPYAQAIKDNINAPENREYFTLREALEWAKKRFL